MTTINMQAHMITMQSEQIQPRNFLAESYTQLKFIWCQPLIPPILGNRCD